MPREAIIPDPLEALGLPSGKLDPDVRRRLLLVALVDGAWEAYHNEPHVHAGLDALVDAGLGLADILTGAHPFLAAGTEALKDRIAGGRGLPPVWSPGGCTAIALDDLPDAVATVRSVEQGPAFRRFSEMVGSDDPPVRLVPEDWEEDDDYAGPDVLRPSTPAGWYQAPRGTVAHYWPSGGRLFACLAIPPAGAVRHVRGSIADREVRVCVICSGRSGDAGSPRG